MMYRKNQQAIFLFISFILTSFLSKSQATQYADNVFLQDYSIKFLNTDNDAKLLKVVSDRNGYIQVLSSKGLLRTRAGQLLFPGTLVTDEQDKQTSDKKIAGIGTYRDQLVYIDTQALLSNAWAAKLFSKHATPGAKIFAGGKDFTFLISDGKNLALLKDSKNLWAGNLPGEAIKDIRFDTANNIFWILGNESISNFSPANKTLTKVVSGNNLTCIEPANEKLFVGTTDGYFEIDAKTKKQTGTIHTKMPWPDLTTISNVDGTLWFGSTWGAMQLRKDGKFNYYASKRWLPSDTVISIAKGPDNSVLVLTTKGLGQIYFKEMSLHDKAMFYEKQVRNRHIRLGFNATVSNMKDGDVTTGSMEDSDNDGLWTSMYLAGETFRYAVTQSPDALQNVRESLDAIERLYTINPVPGFPSRSFERRGYKYHDPAWRRADDPEWDWKSTTSSDEAIGHIFALGAIAELVHENDIRNKAIMLIDTLMSTIVKNDFYMIDWDGKPTRWGRWHPDYVNARPENVGDRKINSSNIIAMLQTAYYFTKKEKYKQAAFYLLNEKGYLKNLMRPMAEIGHAPDDADELSKELSDGWNHSDDEMYYCGYWGLYRYALNDTLKADFKKAIIDHWQRERPEKEGLWNIMTALTGTKDFDLNEAIWYLQNYPLDLVNWTVKNSQRKDIELVAPNFRKQTTTEVLPPDELGISRHNSNRFDLDDGDGGRSEYSAGDIWLLPYWIGRYLGVISAPVK
ncbi:hypothetical protein [Parafilimonas sp.]|uniref:hypothetical protein n=1 Tax=Parafilimonas sp. TaxID=1969739 RepID=UPI003F7EBBE3